MEKINTLKPDYKIMRMIFNQCLVLNGSKTTAVVLLKVLIQSLLYSLAMTPIMLSLFSGGSNSVLSIGTIAIVALIFLAVFVVDFILDYGLNVAFSRAVERRELGIGLLFCGFKDKSKKVLKASILWTIVSVAVTVAIGFVVWKIVVPGAEILEKLSQEEIASEMFSIMMTFSSAMTVTSLLLRIPILYLWLVIYRRNDLGVFRALKISATLLFKQFFRFFGFVFYICWRDLVIFVVLIVVNTFLSMSSAQTYFSIITTLVSFFQFIQEFRILVKFNMIVPVYFYSMTGVLEVHVSDFKKYGQEQIEHSDNSDANNDGNDDLDNKDEPGQVESDDESSSPE